MSKLARRIAASAKSTRSVDELIELGYPEGTARKIASGELPMDQASRMARASEQGFLNDTYHATKQDFTEFKPGYSDGLAFTTPEPSFANNWLGKGRYRDRLGAEDEVEKIRKEQSNLRNSAFDFDELDRIEAEQGKDAWLKAYDEMSLNGRTRAERDVPSDRVYGSVYPMRVRAQNIFDPSNPEHFDQISGHLAERMGGKVTPDQEAQARAGNYLFYETPETVDLLKDAGYDSMRLAEYGGPLDTVASFDTSDLRSRYAAFDPDNEGKKNLLGAGAAAAVGLGALASPEDAEAGVVERAGMLAGPEIKDQFQAEGMMGALDAGWGALQNAGKFVWDASTNFGSALMGEENEVPTVDEYQPMTDTGRAINQAAGGAFDALMGYQPPLTDQTIGQEIGGLIQGYQEDVRPWLKENVGEYGTKLGEAGAGLLAAVGIPSKTRKAADSLDNMVIPSVREFTPEPGYVPPAAIPRPDVNAPDRPITPEPERIPALFGSKAEREAAQVAQIEANAGMLADENISNAKGAAISPDYYRDLYNREGLDAVLAEAKDGAHLKPTPTGYVGVPRHIRDQKGIEDMRGSLDEQLDTSAEALAQAESAAGTPERIGTWYPRAKEFNWQVNEPHQMNRWLEGVGTYSAGVAPVAELGFNLKHWNSRAVGDPKMAYRGAPMRNLDMAVAEDRDAILGFKIGEYGLQKNNPAVTDPSPFGVNDFRMAQTFGYTDPGGKPWKGGVSATMHPVMDAETALLVDRANEGSFAGKTDWTGETAQEIPWVGGKAQDIYGRGKNGRFSGPDGQAMALREANNTAADYANKREMAATYEATPGANSGHRQDITEGSLAEKQAYQEAGPWTFDDRGMDKDVLYSALGFRQQPTVDAAGVYRNSRGEVEHNPVKLARPLVDFQTVEQPSKLKRERARQREEGRLTTDSVAPSTMRAVEGAENLRGLIDAQEASAANLPVTRQSRGGRNDLLIDTGGTQATQEQMGLLTDLLEGTGLDPTATSRGVLAMNFNELSKDQIKDKGLQGRTKTAERKRDEANARLQSKVAGQVEQRADEIQGIFPNANVERAASETAYMPGAFGPEQYTGKYTMNALDRLANMPEEAWRNIAESEDVRTAIRTKIERDQGHPMTRKDLQETRKFFADESWQDVVDLIRKGMKPAAALAALGFSANSMADEEQGALAE